MVVELNGFQRFSLIPTILGTRSGFCQNYAENTGDVLIKVSFLSASLELILSVHRNIQSFGGQSALIEARVRPLDLSSASSPRPLVGPEGRSAAVCPSAVGARTATPDQSSHNVVSSDDEQRPQTDGQQHAKP